MRRLEVPEVSGHYRVIVCTVSPLGRPHSGIVHGIQNLIVRLSKKVSLIYYSRSFISDPALVHSFHTGRDYPARAILD